MGQVRIKIEQLANEVHAGCGLNYELFVKRFSVEVERYLSTLSQTDREAAERVARSHEYTPTKALMDYERGKNECIHHFDYNTCPLGCGDLDIANRPF